MSPKQSAVVMADLLNMQAEALKQLIHHTDEAARYRKAFNEVTDRILHFPVVRKKTCKARK